MDHYNLMTKLRSGISESLSSKRCSDPPFTEASLVLDLEKRRFMHDLNNTDIMRSLDKRKQQFAKRSISQQEFRMSDIPTMYNKTRLLNLHRQNAYEEMNKKYGVMTQGTNRRASDFPGVHSLEAKRLPNIGQPRTNRSRSCDKTDGTTLLYRRYNPTSPIIKASSPNRKDSCFGSQPIAEETEANVERDRTGLKQSYHKAQEKWPNNRVYQSGSPIVTSATCSKPKGSYTGSPTRTDERKANIERMRINFNGSYEKTQKKVPFYRRYFSANPMVGLQSSSNVTEGQNSSQSPPEVKKLLKGQGQNDSQKQYRRHVSAYPIMQNVNNYSRRKPALDKNTNPDLFPKRDNNMESRTDDDFKQITSNANKSSKSNEKNNQRCVKKTGRNGAGGLLLPGPHSGKSVGQGASDRSHRSKLAREHGSGNKITTKREPPVTKPVLPVLKDVSDSAIREYLKTLQARSPGAYVLQLLAHRLEEENKHEVVKESGSKAPGNAHAMYDKDVDVVDGSKDNKTIDINLYKQAPKVIVSLCNERPHAHPLKLYSTRSKLSHSDRFYLKKYKAESKSEHI